MTNNRAARFLKHLDGIFGQEPEFARIESSDRSLPSVTAIIYKDIPEEGHITGLTFGLSEVAHPAWKFGRPELIISVNSEDKAWPLAVASMAEGLRGRCPFSYGDIINFGDKIADESEMSAFFIFAPSILEKAQFLDIDVGPYKINIAGVYPIYEGEREVLAQIGMQSFWNHPTFDLYDVTRQQVRIDG